MGKIERQKDRGKGERVNKRERGRGEKPTNNHAQLHAHIYVLLSCMMGGKTLNNIKGETVRYCEKTLRS